MPLLYGASSRKSRRALNVQTVRRLLYEHLDRLSDSDTTDYH